MTNTLPSANAHISNANPHVSNANAHISKYQTKQQKKNKRLDSILSSGIADSLESATVMDRIATAPGKFNRNSAQAAKISRKIELARQWTKQSVVCELTGVVILLEIPRIPGSNVLVYTSPLSIVENARGIAQQNWKYLSSLDTQILAAVLITLADDYSLFRYAPTFSGAEKNALLRSCNKQEIINAIQVIETFVNSNNVVYLPQLSFLTDADSNQSTFENNLHCWNKLVVDAIRKPDLVEYDSDATLSTPMSTMSEIIKRDRLELSAKSKEEAQKQRDSRESDRKFKADMKLALAYTKELRKAGIISAKQKDILSHLCDPMAFATIPATTIRTICTKLELIESEEGKTTLANLSKLLLRNVESQIEDNEFMLADSTSSVAEGPNVDSILPDDEQNNTEQNAASQNEQNETQEEANDEEEAAQTGTEIVIEVQGTLHIVDANAYNALSPIQQLRFKPALAQNAQNAQNEKKQEAQKEEQGDAE